MRDVLLVEDDRDVAAALKEGLQQLGLGVHLAPSVAAATGAMSIVLWDAVVTDWSLGDGSGADVLRTAAQQMPDARRIVISGIPHPEATELAHQVLVKPVSLHTIAAAVAAR